MTSARILLVDDDEGIRFAVRDFLVTSGFEVEEADSCRSAREVLQKSVPDAVILDYKLPDGPSLSLIPHVKRPGDDAALIMLTGHASIDLAVEAMKAGADHFMTKPVDLPGLKIILDRVLANRRTHKRDTAARSRSVPQYDPFLGGSAAIRRLREEARRVAAADTPVLLQGETGSGKGVLATWIHQNSTRASEAFVDLNCAGLSREFLESELFGHERGAFTGAVAAKQGLFDVADEGSIFLDEIGDMDAAVQAKLLKVVEEKKFRRLGDVRDRRVDMRLICATHHDLGQLVATQRFRSDLYYRLSAFRLIVPPLRERREDIAGLAHYLVSAIARDLGKADARLGDAALAALQQYAWPGNIRELRNVIERALLLTDTPEIHPEVLRFDDASPEAAALATLASVEREHILRTLESEGGHVERAAARLGIARSSLYQKLRDYGIQQR
ncbi:MAG TPA: sigma-54 dependent transcriptional regulator [Thermoanaerobaculia bacterium]|nr:sigma-54 dependent transcriptional regulator [Thermoanaerobaculia bacterium]